jgi:hypothetical protein
MAVKKPLNLNDEEIADEGVLLAQPVGQPTCMSYFLIRLRLVETMRALIDRAPLSGFDPYEVSYNHILQIDATISRFL